MNRINANATQLQEEIMPKTADLCEIHAPNMLEDNRELVELGCALHWLHPESKRPIGNDWSEKPRADLDKLNRTYNPGNNIGLRLGEPSLTPAGYSGVIDLDIRDDSKLNEAIAKLLEFVPNAFDLPTVQSGSGGSSRHFHVTSPQPLRSRKLAKSESFTMVWDARKGRKVKKHDWEIELLGTGKQVVLPPSIHPDTKLPYKWLKRPEMDLMVLGIGPKVAVERLGRAEPEAIETEDPLIAELLGPIGPRARFKDIRAALEIVGDHDDRDTWLRIGAALHHWDNGGDSGYQLWCEWSERSEKFDGKDQARTWKSLGRSRGRRVTVASIFDMARRGGWCPWTDDDFEDLPEPFEDLLGGDAEALDLTGAADKPKAALRFLTPSDCEAASAREYLIKGFLSRGDVGAVVGAPGAGKSLIAPYLGYMFAKGEQAFGMRTKKGGVFYVAAEDPHGMRGRIKALRKEHGDAEGFHLVEGVSDLLSTDSPDMAALLSAAKEQRPALIVIDTLALAFPGLEENDAAAMGRVIAVTRALTKWGAAVLLVHHDAKSGDGLPRGHSSLNGNLDVAMNVKFDAAAGVVRGELRKNKNGSMERDIAFKIAVEQAGTDEDGDPITLPRCHPFEGEYGKMSLSPSQQKLLQILSEMADFEDGEEVPEAELKMRCIEFGAVSGADNEESRKRVYRKAKSDLASEGVIRVAIRESDGVEVVKWLKFNAVPGRDCEPG